jgi:hypothetical protein
MKLRTVTFAVLVLAVLVAAPAAQAQATRTWVSGVGDDANPCSRTAPCKTFAGAISKTAAGGEISALDPGGFGAVTITKAITINGDGTLAGILNSLTTGVIINALATDDIVLRNISINGATNGITGIRFLAGKSLTVDNVTITGFTSRGIDFSPSASGNLNVRNTRITKGPTGIFLSSTTGLTLAVLDQVSLQGLTDGLNVGANARASVSNSVISNNSTNGVLTSNGTAQINLRSTQVAFDAVNGVNCANNLAQIRISDCSINNNTNGLVIAAGCVISSAGNNQIFANGATANPNGSIPPL